MINLRSTRRGVGCVALGPENQRILSGALDPWGKIEFFFFAGGCSKLKFNGVQWQTNTCRGGRSFDMVSSEFANDR